MKLTVEIDREVDGRIIADIPELSGVLVYGNTEAEAISKVQALALKVLAYWVEHGESMPELINISFVAA